LFITFGRKREKKREREREREKKLFGVGFVDV
jgi:hypothetical protein